MKDIGILYKEEMVVAILQNRKTLTSRLRGLDEINEHPSRWRYCGASGAIHSFQCAERAMLVKCPYGQAGDRLWVRETWQCPFTEDDPGRGDEVVYRATPKYKYGGPWRPGIHMFRWASRITLQVVKVWPSRLQDMTDEMAIQEGLESRRSCSTTYYRDYTTPDSEFWITCARVSYESLWDRINAKPRGKKPGRPWAGNWWVWRIQFKHLKTET